MTEIIFELKKPPGSNRGMIPTLSGEIEVYIGGKLDGSFFVPRRDPKGTKRAFIYDLKEPVKLRKETKIELKSVKKFYLKRISLVVK